MDLGIFIPIGNNGWRRTLSPNGSERTIGRATDLKTIVYMTGQANALMASQTTNRSVILV